MVRPTSTVWNHFIEYRSGSKKTAKCKYCQKKYCVPNATKMAKHLDKCTRKPIALSVPVYSASRSDDDPTVILGTQELVTDMETINVNANFSGSFIESPPPPDAAIACTSTSTSSSTENETLTRPVIRSFFDYMSKAKSDRLDSFFAKAVYSSNLPLSLTENSYWQKFFNQIRPSYTVPSRHDLTNKLLDKEYEDTQKYVKEQIENADFVTVITDGWSNIRNEGIVSYVVTTPTPIFYKSVETKENRHTAEYISSELIEVIKEIGPEKVTALVTDHASNMKAAWKIVQAKYAHIFTLGCAAHGLNLLLSDICKTETFHMITSKAKELIKYVKNKQALLSVFSSKQKLKKGLAASTLELPSETRRCSTLIMFESLLNGKESLQETVLIEDLNVDKEIRFLVLNNDIFWASLHSLVNVLTPICDGIKKLESDSATLSDVQHVFSCINRSLDSLAATPLQTSEEETIKDLVKSREKIICQPIHYAAYVLDPRYMENYLNADCFNSAVNFISEFPLNESASNILSDFAQYKSRDSVYSNNAVWESAKLITPRVWWKGFFKGQCLCAVALRLFTIPPSSAACERVFSAFSHTHTSIRNRLTNERISKLVSVRSNLILQSKQLTLDALTESEND